MSRLCAVGVLEFPVRTAFSRAGVCPARQPDKETEFLLLSNSENTHLLF